MKKYVCDTYKEFTYTYNVYEVSEIDNRILQEILTDSGHYIMEIRSKRGKNRNNGAKHFIKAQIRGGKHPLTYIHIPMAFDIETNSQEHSASVYIWQFGLGHSVIMGRTLPEFINLLDMIDEWIGAEDYCKIKVWVHNLPFEFQFLRGYLNISAEDCFLKTKRSILFFNYRHFQFSCSMAMTNMSLAKLADTYTNTQKCKGDLDYTMLRNTKTQLTEQELKYCHNDVLILLEYSEYYYKEFILNKTTPLTQTAILNNLVKAEFKEWLKEFSDDRIIKAHLKKCWQTYDFYKFMRTIVYRGGFVHANELAVGYTFQPEDNVYSYDFTSSYPYCLFAEYFPEEFYQIENPTIELLDKMCETHCVAFSCTFKNIRAKEYGISLESESKCVFSGNYDLDNGRVRFAECMQTAMCELDYASYKEFYMWDSMEIHKMFVSERHFMAEYVVRPMLGLAVEKTRLKNQGLPYMIPKQKLNSIYGLTVKSVNEERVLYNGQWINEPSLDWDKTTNGFLLPYWGIWVSGHARRNLVSSIYKLAVKGYAVLYSDTDSIKILNFDEGAKQVIDEYNEQAYNKMLQAKERYKISDEDFEAISEFGQFDCEGQMLQFKTLGAKRYVYQHYNKKKGKMEYKQTIAGLPEGALEEYANEREIDIFEAFTDGVHIPICGKLCSKYFDEPTSTEIDGEYIFTPTGISLLPTDFTMTINGTWKEYLESFDTLLELERIYGDE